MFSNEPQSMAELSRILPEIARVRWSMTGGWRTRARALPCVHRASSIEHRTLRSELRVLGTKHWLH